MKDLFELQQRFEKENKISAGKTIDVLMQLNEKLNICYRRIDRMHHTITILKYLLVIVFTTMTILIWK